MHSASQTSVARASFCALHFNKQINKQTNKHSFSFSKLYNVNTPSD